MRFQNWAQSAITAEEEKGTSVLNVKFRDTDKSLVLPITQMISQAYQNYSNRGRDRELTNVITYLETRQNHKTPGKQQSRSPRLRLRQWPRPARQPPTGRQRLRRYTHHE